MTRMSRVANRLRQWKSYYTSNHLHWPRLYWYILIIVLLTCLSQLHHFRALSPANLPHLWSNSRYLNYLDSMFQTPEPTSTEAPEFVVEMNEEKPLYKLTIRADDRPYLNVDRARANLMDKLRLYETCQKDPSTIVVDVGAHLGNFGLYAAACGCTVYMYEAQPDMVKLIRSSIKHNSFPAPRVHLFHKAVNNLPSNSTVPSPPSDGAPTAIDNPPNIRTIRLDDVKWSSAKIFMLRVDADGAEMSVLRSAKNLFAEKRVQHLLFRYTPWTPDHNAQQTLMSHIKKELKAKFIFTLFHSDDHIYGPLRPKDLNMFHERQIALNVLTDVYALFDEKIGQHTFGAKRYHTYKPLP